jgi:TetR/AcrR family transcriptional repressor of bet genes
LARTPLRKIRQRELQKAAYEVALRYGISGLTLEKVAQQAGISKGIIHHYFSSKHQLLDYAMRHAHGITGRAVREKLKKAKTPSERVWAVIEVNFLPEVTSPHFFRLWYEAMDDIRLTYLLDIYGRRERSNLISALKGLTDSQNAADLAYTITNLYDGYSALISVDRRFTAESILPLIAEFVKDLIPEFDMSIVRLGERAPETRMPVTRIRDLRRQELLAAAFAVMKRNGLPATTIDKIAQEAGYSKGVVLHYFENKDALIYEAVRQVYDQHRKEIAERLHAAKTPSERIWAIVSAHLDPMHLNRDNCNVWISVISETFTNSDFSRLQRNVHKRERSALLHALRQISSEEDARNSADGLMALMQAFTLWTGYIAGYGSTQALPAAQSFLRTNVPGFDSTVLPEIE